MNSRGLSHADKVIFSLSNWIRLFSMEDNFRISEVGRSMVLNLNILQNRTQSSANETLFQSVEDFLLSLADECLQIVTATQLVATSWTS